MVTPITIPAGGMISIPAGAMWIPAGTIYISTVTIGNQIPVGDTSMNFFTHMSEFLIDIQYGYGKYKVDAQVFAETLLHGTSIINQNKETNEDK